MASSLYKFGGCINPSKIRPGNKTPFDSMLGMLGSTPILNINTLTERMNLFQGRALPEVFIKLECARQFAPSARPSLPLEPRPLSHS